MNYQDRYDELETIIDGLESIIYNINNKEDIDILNELKYGYQDELDEVSDRIYEQEKAEQREMNIQYERSRL